jgi:hypothetical protein
MQCQTRKKVYSCAVTHLDAVYPAVHGDMHINALLVKLPVHVTTVVCGTRSRNGATRRADPSREAIVSKL